MAIARVAEEQPKHSLNVTIRICTSLICTKRFSLLLKQTTKILTILFPVRLWPLWPGYKKFQLHRNAANLPKWIADWYY